MSPIVALINRLPSWSRGLVLASVMTVGNAVMLVWINQVPPAPTGKTEQRRIPIAFPTMTPKRPKPIPVPAELVSPLLSELAPAAPVAAEAAVAAAPTLPTLALSLPGFGNSAFQLSSTGNAGLGSSPSATKRPRGITQAARPTQRPPPRYPRTAARRGLEGEVVVRVSVSARGAVTDAVIVRAEPPGIFDAAALSAARRYRFAPATKEGDAVATTLEQRILFRVPK